MVQLVTYSHVLIIRVWNESSEGDPKTRVWRCMIEDAENMKRFYFSAPSELFHFLIDHIVTKEVS
jgi:hypothetical protein